MRLPRFISSLLCIPVLLVACNTLAPEPATNPAEGEPEAVAGALAPVITPLAAGTEVFPFSQVSAGAYHSCGLKSDGSVTCWGNNSDGQSTLPSGPLSQVSAGGFHTCGLIKPDGRVTCWGRNAEGQTNAPGGTFSQVSAGRLHTCGVKQDGSVACWGWNNFGQNNVPGGTFSQVSANQVHTCGVKSDGSVACWGSNTYGQSNVPGGTFSQVSAGVFHTCGLKQDGSVACWGRNDDGQSNAPGGTFSQVSASLYHTCGVKQDGSVACWGYNGNGQTNAPSGTFSQVSAGQLFTCGLKQDGSVACWGSNNNGQSSAPSVPVLTTQPTDQNATVGGSFTLSVTATGTGPLGYQWRKDGTNITGATTSTYTVSAATMADAGSYDVVVTNAAGRATSEAATVVVTSDSTGPVITPTVTGTLGSNGWYTSNVGVSWNVTDAESAVTNPTGCDSTTLSSDTSGVTLTCEATSAGGTSSESVTIKRDATKPALAPTTSPNPVLLNGSATATPNASDATSGLASQSCATVVTNSVGSKSVSCTATDNAGNESSASLNYTVTYAFSGFLQPVDNNVVNKAKAGQAIALKWRLTDANGAPVTTLSSVQLSVASLSCSFAATPNTVAKYASRGSSLQNLGDGYYQYNWATPKSYAGSCKTLQLDLNEGLYRTAAFQFTR